MVCSLIFNSTLNTKGHWACWVGQSMMAPPWCSNGKVKRFILCSLEFLVNKAWLQVDSKQIENEWEWMMNRIDIPSYGWESSLDHGVFGILSFLAQPGFQWSLMIGTEIPAEFHCMKGPQFQTCQLCPDCLAIFNVFHCSVFMSSHVKKQVLFLQALLL